MWPPSFALRAPISISSSATSGLAAPRIAAVRTELTSAEKAGRTAAGGPRSQNWQRELTKDAPGAGDQAKVKMLSAAITDLAGATR